MSEMAGDEVSGSAPPNGILIQDFNKTFRATQNTSVGQT